MTAETMSLADRLRFLRPTAKFKLSKDEFYMVGEVMHEAARKLEKMQTLLRIAVDEFEVTEGRIISNSDHWTVQARELLK